MLIIDGLQCGHYDRETLIDLRDSGIGAVTVTASFWEDALETMDALTKFNDLAHDNADVAGIVRSGDDLDAITASGRVGIVLGTQNTTPFNDRIGFVEHFWQMGLRVVQLTYNTQNAIGGSCYEPTDSGLTRFGREVVSEMNRVGIVVDLSHVGDATGIDAIERSDRPVLINHANARSIYDHPRNKGERVLQALVAHDGVLGVCSYNNVAGSYAGSAEGLADLIVQHVELLGIDHIAYGSDMSPNGRPEDLEWMRTGRWTRSAQSGARLENAPEPPAEWMDDFSKIREVADLLISSGRLTAEETAKVVGGNFARIYRDGFTPA